MSDDLKIKHELDQKRVSAYVAELLDQIQKVTKEFMSKGEDTIDRGFRRVAVRRSAIMLSLMHSLPMSLNIDVHVNFSETVAKEGNHV